MNADIKALLEKLDSTAPLGTFPARGPSFVELSATSSDNGEAVMANNAVVSFASTIQAPFRQDTLDSTMIATLIADKVVGKNKNAIEWYEVYIDTLKKLGWVLEQDEKTNMESDTQVFKIDKALFDLFGAMIGSAFAGIIQGTIDKLKQLGDADGRILAFEKNTNALSKQHFQLGLASFENDMVSFSVGGFMLETTKNIKQILFFKNQTEGLGMKYRLCRFTLHQELYEKSRPLVKAKLGAIQENQVNDLFAVLD